MSNALMPDEHGPVEATPRLKQELPAVLAGLLAGVFLVAVSYVGSRGFKDFDVALIGYFVGTVFAIAALVYRYTLWISRPPTWRYFRGGWSNLFSWANFRRDPWFLPKTIWHDLIAQTFIWKRGKLRWVMHQAIFWGVLGSLGVTIPLTLGWIRFTLAPPDDYIAWFFGMQVMRFPIEAGAGFALFHILDWTALLLVVGVSIALWRRVTDLGLLSTQRFGFDLMPLVMLLAIAVTGLLLTASSMWWHGRFYWFISLSHQVIVVTWLLSIPYGKFFHVVQRPASVGVKLYQAANADPETGEGVNCRGCGEGMPSAQFVTDLKTNVQDLGMNFDLGGDRGFLQDYCPTCKRTMRGSAYYELLGKRFL